MNILLGTNSPERRWDSFMMGYGNFMGGGGSLGFLTWLLLIVFLILGIIYFWNQINKKK